MPIPPADNWYGLLAPAKTPTPAIAKIRDATVAALADPEVAGKLTQSGAIPAATSSAEFGQLLADELARWGRVIRDKGIKAEP